MAIRIPRRWRGVILLHAAGATGIGLWAYAPHWPWHVRWIIVVLLLLVGFSGYRMVTDFAYGRTDD